MEETLSIDLAATSTHCASEDFKSLDELLNGSRAGVKLGTKDGTKVYLSSDLREEDEQAALKASKGLSLKASMRRKSVIEDEPRVNLFWWLAKMNSPEYL